MAAIRKALERQLEAAVIVQREGVVAQAGMRIGTLTAECTSLSQRLDTLSALRSTADMAPAHKQLAQVRGVPTLV